MESKIQGYQFEGEDEKGLKFLAQLNWDELETVRYAVENKGKASIFDSRDKTHWEVTKSAGGIYVVSKVEPKSSGWF
ncbi:MAG: hypothetical protein WD898_01245 [Candidatus Paceibacterota bacterium]